MRDLILLVTIASLTGYGVVALPFRVTGDVLQVVPVAGKVAAVPFEAAGNVID